MPQQYMTFGQGEVYDALSKVLEELNMGLASFETSNLPIFLCVPVFLLPAGYKMRPFISPVDITIEVSPSGIV